ncbi:ATP synthase subunit I [Rhodoferax sp.]|uniref:ATP synthase subunit I n=1 Tax=Rhodoferax sp. TaxID=50421 RepID=UPI00374D55B5
MADTADRFEDEVAEDDFKPLTAVEAQQWRQRQTPFSLWWVVLGQAVTGCLVAVAAWLLTGKPVIGWSAAYGALSVVVPAALFARGVTGRLARTVPGAAMVGFFVWELVKIAVTVAMLFAAPRLIPGLNWLALLAGFVVTMKVVWLALLFRAKRQSPA